MGLLIRQASSSELATLYPVFAELRPSLDFEMFQDRYLRQAPLGFELHAAFDPEVVGVIGVRPQENMGWGKHLHIDDLVVTESRRRSQVGRLILAYIERLALERGLPALYLESRPDVTGFYEAQGYEHHRAKLMWKKL